MIPQLKEWDIIGNAIGSSLEKFDVKLFGDYNTAPANFREVTESIFCAAGDHHHYCLIATDFRQLLKTNKGAKMKLTNVYLYINGLGLGYGLSIGQDKVRYFLFELCNHEYVGVESAMCYRKSRCKLCGTELVIDSSD